MPRNLNLGERRWSSKEWIFWNYYASVVWTETWTCCGKPCGSWWRHHGRRAAQIGAQHGERSPERVTYRNGYRGMDQELHIPKLRQLLPQPAGTAAAQRESPAGRHPGLCVSTRRVDDLIKPWVATASPAARCRASASNCEVVESFLGPTVVPNVWLDGLTHGRAVASQRLRGGGDGGQCRRAA